MFKGNKIRFINEPTDEADRNCSAKAVLCNTVIRLAIYATRDLKVKEELFLYYGEE